MGQRVRHRPLGSEPEFTWERTDRADALAAAAGRVPIHANAFTIIDEQGQVSHLGVSTSRGGSPPAQVAPGQTVRLTMKTILPEGEYILRWAPSGHTVLVGWEFNVELD